MGNCVLAVTNFTVGHASATALWPPLSLAVFEGTVTAILGRNGAGKTTLLRSLMGLLPRRSGTIEWQAPARGHAPPFAYVPQEDSGDIQGYTVWAAVALGRSPHRDCFGRGGAADHAVIEAALAATRLAEYKERAVSQLSGGERRRVTLARALATEATTLLMDEPLAHLDPGETANGIQQIRRLADAGRTVLMTTHDVAVAAALASHVLLLTREMPPVYGPVDTVLQAAQLEKTFGVAFRPQLVLSPV
jgi:iron complex transport system ATP-binding protein